MEGAKLLKSCHYSIQGVPRVFTTIPEESLTDHATILSDTLPYQNPPCPPGATVCCQPPHEVSAGGQFG